MSIALVRRDNSPRTGRFASLPEGYNFCVYFAAEPQLMGQNPALYENVSRLVQFWL